MKLDFVVGATDSFRLDRLGKFVVSRAGEAYDVRARGPNRKFRLTGCSKKKLFLYAAEHSTTRSRTDFFQ
jgi:hypothetical protein